jgi:aryl-alcohol dehydrogenase-like predicted oxidoreductase
MKEITMPDTDLSVSPIALGSSEFGKGGLVGKAGFELLDEYVALGGNFIDTAHVYADWLPGEKSSSEKAIGRWLAERKNRDRVVLGTKGAHPDLATMDIPRLSRQDIARDLNESLDYLQTDWIDIYWLHRDDTDRPVSEIIETLNEQVKAGKIRYFGCSNWKISRIQEAQDYAAKNGIQGFAANQPMWSLAAPDMDAVPDKTLAAMDRQTMDFHRKTGMAVIPYSSQAKGFLTKLATGAATSEGDRRAYDNAANRERLKRAQTLAQRYGVTVTEIALAYFLGQPFVVVPIIGPKRTDHLRESLKAVDVNLTADEVEYLEGE